MKFTRYVIIAQQALRTPQGQAVGRAATDGLAGFGNRLTRNRYSSQIEQARQALHKQLAAQDPKARRRRKRR
jgi:hypothetical protein